MTVPMYMQLRVMLHQPCRMAADMPCVCVQVDLQPRVGTSGAGISREAFIGNVARDVGSKIPEPFDTQLLRKTIGIPSPTQVVLLQETERWNKVQALLLLTACALRPQLVMT